MDIPPIQPAIDYTFEAIKSGVIYDAIKGTLLKLFGTSSDRIVQYAQDNDKDKFEATLQTLIESNSSILQGLQELQKQYPNPIINQSTNTNIVYGNQTIKNGSSNFGNVTNNNG